MSLAEQVLEVSAAAVVDVLLGLDTRLRSLRRGHHGPPGHHDVAITNLAQAVLVAHEKHETVDQLALRRRVQNIIRTGGGFA